MGRLIYSAIVSLDGYINDAAGSFDWAQPDPEVHAFVNDTERSIGTHLLGRRMYETMAVWDTVAAADVSPEEADYATIWRAADKVVYSTTLAAPSTARTRLERTFEPDAVRQLKASAPADLSVSGAGLAAHAISAGLVDAYHVILVPVIVGGGTRFLPDGVRVDLALEEMRGFGNGTAFLHYRAT